MHTIDSQIFTLKIAGYIAWLRGDACFYYKRIISFFYI